MRGTEFDVHRLAAGGRITPACAGNSGFYLLCKPSPQDHPRVCGEQSDHRREYKTNEGSPPRVRGTEAVMGTWDKVGGITPACAGNSPAPFPMRPTSGDHPRVCGEQLYYRKANT